MRALKLTLAFAFVLGLLQYIPVYYHSSTFNDFVDHETQRPQGKRQLKEALLTKAKEFALPIRAEDVNITTVGSVLRVAVDYRVPVNFYVFDHELAFHTVSAGLTRSEQ